MEDGGANRIYPTGLFQPGTGLVHCHNAGNFYHTRNRSAFAGCQGQTYVGFLPAGNDSQLFAYAAVLWDVALVGITPAVCWHAVSGNDLDIGHEVLAGQGLALEGQDLLTILECRFEI